MKTPAGAPADPLVLLQLRVARRADELASRRESERRALSLNLSCWLKAEEEVFACTVAPSDLLERLAPRDS